MEHVLSVLVKNEQGVLGRVASLFSRRNFNIDSLTVGVTQDPAVSRMTVVVRGDEYLVDQMIKQLDKLHDVITVQHLADSAVCRSVTLVKIRTTDDNRMEMLKIGEIFGAKIVDIQPSTLIFELTGEQVKLDAFSNMVKRSNIMEVICTGIVGLDRGEHTIQENCEERDYYGKNLL